MLMARAKKATFEFTSAIILFFFVLTMYPAYLQWTREGTATENFFVAKQLYVPDIVEKDKLIITYTRQIRKPFKGTWTAVVQKIKGETLQDVCTAIGEKQYTPEEELQPIVDLEWFNLKSCNLTAGQYRIDVVWRIDAINYPPMETTISSNVFTVLPQLPKLTN